jgi:hypothetical protein
VRANPPFNYRTSFFEKYLSAPSLSGLSLLLFIAPQ